MTKLSELLHELIEHTVPAGNKRGELHAMVDDATAPDVSRETSLPAPDVSRETSPRVPAVVLKEPAVTKPDVAAEA